MNLETLWEEAGALARRRTTVHTAGIPKGHLLLLVCLFFFPPFGSSAQSPSQLASRASQALQHGDYASAERLYSNLARIEPQAPEIYSNRGLAYYFQHKFNLAEADFQTALRLDPRLFVPNLFLGKIDFENGRNREAAPWLKRAIEIQPQDKDARRLLAAVLVGLKRYDQAIEQYKKLLNEDPRDGETLYDLSLVYLDLGKQAYQRLRNFKDTGFAALVLAEFDADRPGFRDAALTEYRQAISLSPQVPGLRIGLGNLLVGSGKWRTAEETFQKELTADPFSYEAFVGLAEVSLHQGKIHPAVVDLDKAVHIRPEFFDPLPRVALPAPARLDRSSDSMLISSADEGSFGAAFLLSELAAIRGQAPLASSWKLRADREREKLISDYKSEFEARLQALQSATQRRSLGLEYIREKRYEEGLHLILPLAAKNPSDSQANLAAARALFHLRRFGEIPELFGSSRLNTPEGFYLLGASYEKLALGNMDMIVKLEPQSAHLHQLLGNADIARERYPDAVREYEAGLKIKPHNSELYFALGNAYFQEMQFTLAQQAYARTIDLDPFNATAYLMRGDALVQLHQPQEAIPLLQRAFELDSHLLGAQAEIGKALAEMGQLQEAVRHLELAASTDKDGSLHYQLFNLYRRLGEPEKARQALLVSKTIWQHKASSVPQWPQPAAK